MGTSRTNGLNFLAMLVAMGWAISACSDDESSPEPSGGVGGGGARSEGGRGASQARGGAGNGGVPTVPGGTGGVPTEPGGSGGAPAELGGTGGVPEETGGIGGVPKGDGGTGAVPTEDGGTGGVPIGEAGSGGDSNTNDPYLQPTWLGACTPIELSEDSSTVLAAEGVWTQPTGWAAVVGLAGSTSDTLLAMSGDGSVVFGESETVSGIELFRWTRAGGAVGLGAHRLVDSQVATDRLGKLLLFWVRDEESDEARPYRWSDSEGVTALEYDLDIACSFREATSLTATVSSDGRHGYFGAIDLEGKMYSCDYGFLEEGKLGGGEAKQENQVMSGDGLSIAGVSENGVKYAFITRAGQAYYYDAARVCAFPVELRDPPYEACPDDADTEITDLAATGEHGVGIERPSSGAPVAIAYRGTIQQSGLGWQYTGESTTLRARLPGYCLQVDGVRPQLSADASTVLAVGRGVENSGCFLANMNTEPPPLPEVPASLSGYGCEGCSTEVVAIGERHQCAIVADRTVDCWGAGLNGELGNGGFVDSLTPERVAGLTNAVQLASTGEHTCARLGDGAVWCWGKNDAGQLGDGSRVNRASPVHVALPDAAIQIAAGAAHSCALLADGTVRCWGQNANGQLGDDTTSISDLPVVVDGISGATQIAAGSRASCALVGTTVQCWGTIYLPDESNKNVSQISMYGDGYCFLSHQTGAQWLNCFGAYFNGGLSGEGVFWSNDVPVISLRAGPSSWCLRLADGRVGCFAATERVYGEIGEIGDSTAYPALPVLGGNGSCRFLPDGDLAFGVRLWGEGVPECAFEPRR